MPVDARPAETVSSRPLPDGFLPSNCLYAEQDWRLLARQWFPLCRADAALAKPRQVVLLNLRLVVYRMPDGIRVGRDLCPHRGLPLSSGRVEGEELICAYHGLRFGSDGQCRRVTEKLAAKTPDCFKMTIFPSVEIYGLVWTCLMPDEQHPLVGFTSCSKNEQEPAPSCSFKSSDDFFIATLKFIDSSENESEESGGGHQTIRNLAVDEYRRLMLEIRANKGKDVPQSSSV